jgi:hypothetical protein
MDIKRVAFETRPVKSTRPAVAVQQDASAPQRSPAASAGAPRIGRAEIAAIVDRFLENRNDEQSAHSSPSAQHQTSFDGEAGSMYDSSQSARQSFAASTTQSGSGGNGASNSGNNRASGDEPSANGSKRTAVDFVSEDDVRRAIQKNEKIYINTRTIITPAARDIGEPAEVFAKV